MSGAVSHTGMARNTERPRVLRHVAKLRVLSVLDLHIRRRCAEADQQRPPLNAPSPNGEGVFTG